jgi:hypothetical protein
MNCLPARIVQKNKKQHRSMKSIDFIWLLRVSRSPNVFLFQKQKKAMLGAGLLDRADY